MAMGKTIDPLEPLLHPTLALTAALRRCQRLMAEMPDASALIADRIEVLAQARLSIPSTG